MKCVGCGNESHEANNYCCKCGTGLHRDNSEPRRESHPSHPTAPSGFGRTLSTEILLRQEKSQTFDKLDSLVECRCYEAGDIIIRKGDFSRDLILLTDGQVEVTTADADRSLLLNEVTAPYILGDIACLLGIPRTATIRAKTRASAYVMRYDQLEMIAGDFPGWFRPLLSAFVSGIKSLNDRIKALEQEERR